MNHLTLAITLEAGYLRERGIGRMGTRSMYLAELQEREYGTRKLIRDSIFLKERQ